MLRIEGLSVRRGGAAVLADLDLDVAAGERFALLGESGSGKSTLLRAVAGFEAPSAGRILLDGRDIGGLAPHERPVNTVFQGYALFPHMTALENVAFGPRRQGMGRAAARARAREVLALARMDAFADRYPRELSGGQQQRVALARALAPRPRLLLLDEPFSALDRGLRAGTRDELARLSAGAGAAFVLVTHDQEEALAIADRVGVLAGGRIVQAGAPRAVYERPASRFVAAFMGVETILPCVVRPDGLSADVPALGGAVAAALPCRPGPGWAAIRAEAVRFGPGGGPNAARGVVESAVFAGGTVRTVLRLPGGAALHAARPADEPGAPPPGAPAAASWSAEATVLLAG